MLDARKDILKIQLKKFKSKDDLQKVSMYI